MSENAPLMARPLGATPLRWPGVDCLSYKEEGSAPFHAITRQVLFSSDDFSCELRYFEIATNGFSTLERHGHAHGVVILRGQGHCLVGREVRVVRAPDRVMVPPWTWHQFRANCAEPLGFLCMVAATRDAPVLPTDAELVELASDPAVNAFLYGQGLVNDRCS